MKTFHAKDLKHKRLKRNLRLLEVLIFTIILLIARPSHAQYDWRQISPLPTGNTINDVVFTSTNNAIAVGNSGTVLQSDDGGINWLTFNSPTIFSNDNILHVDFADANNGYILLRGGDQVMKTNSGGEGSWTVANGNGVGISGPNATTEGKELQVLNATTVVAINSVRAHITSNSGDFWTDITPSGLGVSPNFRDIYFVDPNLGYILSRQNGLFKTTNGGTSWTQLTAFTGIEASIVYFENEMNGWVVEGTGSSLTNTIHRTTDGGATWNSQTYPGGNQTARELIFTSSTDGKLFDGNKIYTSDDAGISWTLEDSFPFSPSSISYNSMDASFLLGGSDGNLGIYDNGTFVSLSNSLTKTANIADIHFNDLNNGFVVDSKDVHRTSDGGISWFSLGLSDMVDVEFATTSIGFLISSSKSVQKTTNGGITWSEVSVLNAGSYFPQSSDFLDVNTGWVVGTNSSVFKTVDGGTSWSAQTLPTPALTLYDVFFIDSNNGYISGSGGNVFKTTDGGTNWTNVGFAGSNGVWEMFWADASTGWLATTRVWKTTDGGASWSADNFPGHGTARDIQFLDANTGFATYDGGVIYQTADAGDSWTIFLDGGEVTLSLNDFYAIDIDNMWASGTRTLYNRAFQDATPPTSIGLFVPALDFCPGEEFIATFTADRQIPDETLTVQLSDVFGSFSSPTNIGILGEASTFSGNVVATIPMSVTPGSNYRMRAVIPSLTGSDNGADLSVGGPPDPTSFITSTDQVCKGQSGVPYSIAPVEGMSYLWTYSGSGSLTINGQGTPSVTINYFNSTTSGTLSVVLSNGCGSSSPLELPILVGTPNAGGAAAGGTTVCSGTASPELSVSGHIGQIVRWEQSVTPFSAYTPISSSNSETFTPPGVISETTRFRAVVQDAGCGEAMSSFTIVNVAQPTVGGTVDVLSGNTAIISGTSPGNLSLSGQLGSVLRWEKSVAPFASYTPISHTSTLYNPGALTEDTRFRAVVKNSLCTEEPSGFVEITILDSNPPMIQSLSPSDNAVEVALSANLVITFDEIVQKGTGTINIKRASDDFVLQTYSVNATNTTIAGKIVTINPPVNFPIGIEIYVEVPSTALQDLAGNDFGGIAGDGTWSFNTIRQNQTITFPDPADKTFGDTNFSLSASASSGLPITYSSSDPSVATVSGNTVTIVGAGSTTFTASQAGNSSFNSALDAVQDLNVSKASLSATADNKSKSYGEENPVLTFQYAGFVNSETAAVLDTPPTVSATTTAASDVGVYTILVSGGADNNYDFIYNGGTLSVNKATLTVSADNQNKLYGEENPELTSMFSGFVNGDIVSDLDVLPTVTTPATTTSNVGNYVIAVNGGSDNNYMYAYNGALLSISKAILTVTADNKIITFGDALPTFTLSYSGFANGDNDAHIDVLPSISTTASVGANAGQYDIDLTGGSDNNYSLTLVDGLLTIEKADQTITINSIPDKVTTDGPFIVTASTTSGLSLDYNISSGPASISGPTVTLDGTSGTVVVSVSQVGNVNYNNATETASFNVNDPAKMDQTISFPAIADKTFGDQQFNLSATSTSGLPVTYSVVSGPVSVSGATISINGAGVATIAANQSGDASFNPAMEMTQSFTIGKADQVITIESIADKGLEDDPFEISVSVDSSLPLTHEVVGPANISGTTITLTGSLGLVTVTSSQAGDANHNPVSASTSFNVVEFAKMDQTITFEKIQDKVFGETFSLIATASSGLDISYGVVSGPITVVGSTVTITGTGTAIIAANQSGNGDFNPATEATQTFTVSKAEQAISLTDIDPKFTNDEPFSVTAMVDSGLELEYNVSGPASISGTTLTLDGTVGIVTVTVSQAGNENYASASLSTTFEVVERPLGVEDDLLEIKFYPNPATDFLIIESTASISVRLFDLNGKIIQQDLSQTGKIDVRNVLPGVYLLEITSDHGIVQKRIVKAN